MKKIDLLDEREIALIEQVNAVYLAKGMKKITMDDMAKELKVSKKTLYKYVKNRAELVQKSTIFHVRREIETIEEIQARNLDPINETGALANYVMDNLKKVNPAVHSDLEKYFPESWQLLQEYFGGFVFKSVFENLVRGQKEGVYRADFHPEIIAKIFITKLDLVFDASLFPEDRFSFPQVYVDFIKHHLRGIVSEKGIKILNKIDFTNL